MKKIMLVILTVFAAFSVKISAAEPSVWEKSININFDFTRKLGLASNQFAVWVENEKGILAKNLFVTDFTAGKGREKRPESLPLWRKAIKDAETDGISSATPKSGNIQLEWAMKNEDGESVKNGVYTIFIEATIKWENSVLFTCGINLGENTTIGEITEKISGKSYDKQNLITNVEIKLK